MPRLSLTIDPGGSRSGLSDLQRATNSTVGALQRLARELDRADAGLEEVGREAQRTGQRADQTRGALARLSTTLGTVGAGVSSVRGALFSLQGAFAAIGGGLIIRGFVDLADAAVQAESRLRLVTDGAEELEQVQNALFQASQRTRTEFTAQAELYGRLGLVAQDLGASQQELIGFTEGIGQALAISGTSAQTARGALIQLSQAIGSGIVRAEEFNSINEGAPRILQAVAAGYRETGVSVAELRNLVIDGAVSSREFFDAFLSQSDQLEREFSQTTRTVGQAMVQLRNELLRVTGDVSATTGATSALVSAIDSIRTAVASDGFSRGLTIFANTMALIAENLDVAAVAAGVFLTALAPWSIVIGGIAGGLALLANNLRDATSETRDLERAVEAAIDAEERARGAIEGLSGAALQNATARLRQAEATRLAAQAEAAYQNAIQASIAVDEARARLNDPVAAGITGPGAIGSIEVTSRLRGELEAAQDAFFEAAGAANRLRGESEALESEVAKLAVTLGGSSAVIGGGGSDGGVSGATKRAADRAKEAEKEFKVLGLTVADVPAALEPVRREFEKLDDEVRAFEAAPFLTAIEDIQSSLTDVFQDGLRGNLDSLRDFADSALDIVSRLGANLLSQRLVIPLTVAAGGAIGLSSADLGIPEGVSTGFGGALDAITGIGSGLFNSVAETSFGAAFGLSNAVSTLPGQASQFALTGLGSTLSSVAGFGLPILGAAIPLLTSLFGPSPPSNAVASQIDTRTGAARIVDPDGELSEENLSRSRDLANLGLSELTRLSQATGTGIPFREVAGDISDRDGEILRLTGATNAGGRVDAVVESAEDVTRAVLGGFLEQVEGLGPQLRAAFEGLGDPLTAEIADIERVISGAEIFTSIKAQLDGLDQETAGPFETTLTGLRAQWDGFRSTLEAASLPTERLNSLIAITTQELEDNFVAGLERANRELRGEGFVNQVLDGIEAFRSQFSDADFLGEGGALVRENLELALNNAFETLDLSQLETLEATLMEASDGTELYSIALREVAEAQNETLIASLRAAQVQQQVTEAADTAFESTRDLADGVDEVAETADLAALAVDALADRFSALDEIQEGLLSRTQGEAAARDFRLVSAGLGEFTDELQALAGSSGIGEARAGLEDFLGLARSTALSATQLEIAASEAFGVFDNLNFDEESPADALRRQTEEIAAAANDAYSSLFVSLNTSLTGFANDLANATDGTIAQISRIYDGAISRAETSLDRASQARGIAAEALLSLASQQSTPEARFAAINDEFGLAADRASGGQLGAVQSLADLTNPFLDALGGEFRRGTPEFFEGLTQAQDALRSAQDAAAEQEERAAERLERLTRDSRDFAEDARNLQRQLLEQQTAAVAQQLAKAQEMIDALVAQLAETVVSREESKAQFDALVVELRAVKTLTQRQNTLITNLEENARRSVFG